MQACSDRDVRCGSVCWVVVVVAGLGVVMLMEVSIPAADERAAAEAAAAEYLWAGGRDWGGEWGAVRRHRYV